MTKLNKLRVGEDILMVNLLRSLGVLEFMWISTMTNKMTLKHDKPNYTIDHGHLCHKCSSKGDIYDYGYLLCAICYLSKHDPKRVDKLKRQNRLTR